MRMRDLIVTREAAKMIGRTESALKVRRINGFGPPFFKLGKGVMYDRAELVKWFEAQRREPKHPTPPPVRSRARKSKADAQVTA